jgi:transcriptional repressor NrdR
VIKRSGVVEAFSREKVVAGVRKACQGRPVTDADLATLAQKVEEAIRATGASQIEANEIGLSVLPPLKDLDEVAYLRFASVYQAFDSLNDFEAAVAVLRADRERAAQSVTEDPNSGA